MVKIKVSKEQLQRVYDLPKAFLPDFIELECEIVEECCKKCSGKLRDENDFGRNYGCLKQGCDCHKKVEEGKSRTCCVGHRLADEFLPPLPDYPSLQVEWGWRGSYTNVEKSITELHNTLFNLIRYLRAKEHKE